MRKETEEAITAIVVLGGLMVVVTVCVIAIIGAGVLLDV
jgi:hypothetical protein